jgi:hypothetical protein
VIPFDAAGFLNTMVDTMQAHSVNRHVIDWTSFRSTVLSAAAGATSITATYPAVSTALGLLGDHHSVFQGPTGSFVVQNPQGRSCASPPYPLFPTLPATIGFVRLSYCGLGCDSLTYATSIQDQIRSADSDTLAGWIVDLRAGVGSFYAAVAGLGPILGEGTAGYFIDADQQAQPWGYVGGRMTVNGFTQIQVASPYSVRRAGAPIAVLIGGVVASAGEATLVSFIGRPNTRTFGAEPTCGNSSGNSTYPMGGGYSLVLTTAIDADRQMHVYGGPIAPDELVPDPFQVFDRAAAWVLGAPASGATPRQRD